MKPILSRLGQLKTFVRKIDLKSRLENSIYLKQENKALAFYFMIVNIINVYGGEG